MLFEKRNQKGLYDIESLRVFPKYTTVDSHCTYDLIRLNKSKLLLGAINKYKIIWSLYRAKNKLIGLNRSSGDLDRLMGSWVLAVEYLFGYILDNIEHDN